MKEIAFQVNEQPAGHFTAQALGLTMVAEADDVEGLSASIRHAVFGHFPDPADRPTTIHLYFLCGGAIASACTLPL